MSLTSNTIDIQQIMIEYNLTQSEFAKLMNFRHPRLCQIRIVVKET
jgi:DNA-binding transcriptional regulator YiaG